jgi:hypothetical protein
MKLIRLKTFETNSSSCHSVVVYKGDYTVNVGILIPDDNGIIYLYAQYFGWNRESFEDAGSKALYLLLSYGNSEDRRIVEEVIKEVTGATNLCMHGGKPFRGDSSDFDSRYDYSGIDHQSEHLGREETTINGIPDKDLIKRFIFCDKSILWTDNDN